VLRISRVLSEIQVPVKPLIDSPDPAFLHGKDVARAPATDAIYLSRNTSGCRNQLENKSRYHIMLRVVGRAVCLSLNRPGTRIPPRSKARHPQGDNQHR
jgi:hypothetical protein